MLDITIAFNQVRLWSKMKIPAVCDNCGLIFPSGFNLSKNAQNAYFDGCTSGPCPNCGSMGHVPNGVYNFIGSTINVLSGTTITKIELQRLSEILKSAQKEKVTKEVVCQRISEELPSLSSIKDTLPRSRTDLYAFIAIIIAIISLITDYIKDKNPSKLEINQIIKNIYQMKPPSIREPIVPIRNKNIDKVNKIGRNESCPCGSGIKYKKCCLKKKHNY